jgi:hypothetical protein
MCPACADPGFCTGRLNWPFLIVILPQMAYISNKIRAFYGRKTQIALIKQNSMTRKKRRSLKSNYVTKKCLLFNLTNKC